MTEQLSKEEQAKFVRRCREDIHYFAAHMLNVKRPTWQQATLWDMVMAAQHGWEAPKERKPHKEHGGTPRWGNNEGTPAHRQIAVASGQGPGKTFASVVIMAWRAFRNPGGKNVITAPTMRQAQEVWLAEFRKISRNAHPIWRALVDIQGTRVILGGDRSWIIHCVTSTDDKKLQGFHDDGLTILCEEMSGIERAIIEQFQGTLSNQDCMLIGIGNPNLRDSAFFDCFTRNRHEWQTATMNAEETADWRPDIVDPKRNERLAREYGRDSDIYRVRVLGQFPKSDPDAVFSLEDVEPMTRTDLTLCASRDSEEKTIAMDFARFGTNESVIYVRMGNAIIDYEVMTRTEPALVVAKAFEFQRKYNWRDEDVVYVPDATGMGQGVLYLFYQNSKRVYEFHNGGKAANQRAFGNRMTEAWFDFRARIFEGHVHIPNDPRLLTQLVSRKYKPTEKGTFKLETKQEYTKRIEEDSPDRADALMMAFYGEAFAPAMTSVASSKPRRSKSYSGRNSVL